MKALTIWRPWSQAIAAGPKRIENREWAPPRRLIGEYIAIHAGKTFDEDAALDIQLTFGLDYDKAMCPTGIIAVARLVGSVTESDDPWFCGRYGWVFGEVVALGPIECRGAQGLWDVPADALEKLRAAWRARAT